MSVRTIRLSSLNHDANVETFFETTKFSPLFLCVNGIFYLFNRRCTYLKPMKRLIIILLAIFCYIPTFAQVVNFNTYKSCTGHACKGLNNKTYSVYAFGPWEQNRSKIVLDLTHSIMYIGSSKLEIIEKPCPWIVRRTYKYTKMACIDESLNKVEVKIFFYDDILEPKKIVVSSEKESTRYVAIMEEK